MAKSKRIKPGKPVVHITDWQDADELLRKMGDTQAEIAAAEEEAKDEINEIRAELAERIKPAAEAIDIADRSLEAFAISNKKDFGNSKSKKLNFGIIGWRFSTTTSIKKTTLDLIKENLSAALRKACIIVKESVDKGALAKLTDEQLASVGARRKSKDAFFVEPAKMEAVDYGETKHNNR